MRDKDLSGDFPVNQFGTVVLPLVGEYDVTSETHRTLRDRVIRDLQEIRYAKDIEVVVLRRVRVVGEVNEPGVLALDPTMSIADAIAMAKGRTQLASEGEVLLRRGGEVIDADLLLDARVGETPIRSGDEIFVPRRGWLDRNLTAVVAGASTVASILVTLLIR
jgi:protein involved in polysaccharide export with SLBB domain